MSRKGNCYDNCIIETFFARMKNEMFYGLEKEYSTFKEFQTAVKDYIDYYNNKRIQEKQNGCPLFNTGKHPCVQLNLKMCPGIWVHIKPSFFSLICFPFYPPI